MGLDYSYHLVQPLRSHEFRTADKVRCIGFLLGAVGGVLPLGRPEPFAGNGCSILSDNGGDLITGEKWNELWLWIRIPALIRAKIIRPVPKAFHYFRSLHYWPAHRTQLLQTKQALPVSARGRREGQFDRLLACPGLSHYTVRRLLRGSKSPPVVCYPFSPGHTVRITQAFTAHLAPLAWGEFILSCDSWKLIHPPPHSFFLVTPVICYCRPCGHMSHSQGWNNHCMSPTKNIQGC